MPGTQRSGGFWHSAPGILTAVAGVLTALGGLVIALHQAGLLPRGDSLAGAPSDSVAVEGTRIEETLGDQARTYVNHYDGLVTERGIDFVLYDTNGRGPIEFTMRRE